MTTETRTAGQPIVHVIDDDEAFRRSLENLLRSADFGVLTFASPQAFIDAWIQTDCGCVLLDIRFPGHNGLDFQEMFKLAGILMPVILMTGHADVPTSVRGLKAGATDYLTKPIDDEALVTAIGAAMERDEERCIAEAGVAKVAKRYASLTVREKEVLALVCLGLMNKQIANRIDLSEITVKVHRGTMMKKMAVRSVADLVRAFELLKSANPPSIEIVR